jgi:hypothetical protein
MTKKALLIGTVAAAGILVAGWAFAQPFGPGYGPGFGPHMWGGGGPGYWGGGMGPGMMHWGRGPWMGGGPGFAFLDPAEIGALKSELAITAAQEPAWTKYAQTVQDAATAMNKAREGADPYSVSRLNPQERYAFITKMREEGFKQFGAVSKAADELLAALDDAQKTKARAILPGLGYGSGLWRGAFRGGPPWWGR